MLEAADFERHMLATMQANPDMAALIRVSDPRVLMQLKANAAGLALLSAQLDTAMMEPFEKQRGGTILADAVAKGILPFSRPARLALVAINKSAANVTIPKGRRLFDPLGRVYSVEGPATIAAGANGTISVRQASVRTLTHIAAGGKPFYSVEIPPPLDDEQAICGLEVTVAGVPYTYAQEFANVAVGDATFSLETDEARRLLLKFGWEGVFGTQPKNGDSINITIEDSYGSVTLAAGASFVFEALSSPNDAQVSLTLNEVTFPGVDQIGFDSLRELAKYPSVYDGSAVYRGNFDFLVRRELQPTFLSIWNEQLQEELRGPSWENINKLFVSAKMDGVTDDWLRAEVTRIITAADDSYKIVFVPPIEAVLALSVTAKVTAAYDVGEVESKIRESLLSIYGRGTPQTARGLLAINVKQCFKVLREAIPALQDELSDLRITIPQSDTGVFPEQFRYLSAASITIEVSQLKQDGGVWRW